MSPRLARLVLHCTAVAMLWGVACSKPELPVQAPDAGSVTDAGTTPVVGHQPIGAACQQNADCASLQCIATAPSGYCVATCGGNGGCPTGSTCSNTSNGPLCLASCLHDSDCRRGYQCSAETQVCVAKPSTGCKSDHDCASHQVCQVETGQCVAAPGSIGWTCSQDTDCSEGAQPVCLNEAEGFTGGYCASTCGSAADCGGNNPCVAGLAKDSNGEPESRCFQACKTNSDCRPQYNCLSYQEASFCYPYCKSDGDCPGSGESCDTSTGLCSAEPAPYPAAHPAPPQVVNLGGPVLAAPRLVPIFFANDLAAEVEEIAAFDQQVGASTYWQTTTSEYGVGPATVTAPYQLMEAAPETISDDQIQSWLSDHISSGALPASDANTLYILHYPSGTTITFGGVGGERSCQAFGGYHYSAGLPDGSQAAYAVLPRCSSFNGLSRIDSETSSESHELIEAVTDPYPAGQAAWAQVDDAHAYWQANHGGGELGDMCIFEFEADINVPGVTHKVQRTWSNAAALAGHNPCVPAPAGAVYAAAVPELEDVFTYADSFPVVDVKGVRIPFGQTRTITLDLFSDGATSAPWNVQVLDASSLYGGHAMLSLTLNQSAGQNGDKLNLTIQPLQYSPGSTYIFYLVSSISGQTYHWAGIVGE